MTYEPNLKRSEVDSRKKPLALKAEDKSKAERDSNEEESSISDNDDEIALLTRKFKSFLKRRRNATSSTSSRTKQAFKQNLRPNFISKSTVERKVDPIICYECRKEGHMCA